jgi:ubiquinone/menaquinone biosynthesis C-methylase UbiE
MRLELGSGYHPNMDFDIHLDINPNCPHLEHVGSADNLPWADQSFSEARASDVLEHFSYRDTVRVLKEWLRVLEPGGRIYIQCPNAKLLAERWLKNDLPIMHISGNEMPIDFSASYWICGGQEDETFAKEGDDWRFNAHYTLLSPESLRYYLKLAGFNKVNIESDGGSNMCAWAYRE